MRAITTVFNVIIIVDVYVFISGKVVVLHQPSCTGTEFARQKMLREIFGWILKFIKEAQIWMRFLQWQRFFNFLIPLKSVIVTPIHKFCFRIYSHHTRWPLLCILTFFPSLVKYPSLYVLHSVYQGNSGVSIFFFLHPPPIGVNFFSFPASTSDYLCFHVHLLTGSP